MEDVGSGFRRNESEGTEPHHAWNYWKKRGEIEQAKKEVRCLSALLTFARQTGVIKHENPCFDLKFPESKARDLQARASSATPSADLQCARQTYSANAFQLQWQRLLAKCKKEGFTDHFTSIISGRSE